MSSRGEATRQQILNAAVDLFKEGGFRALRISHVCARANIAPTSVYWHFKNKAGLVQQVLEAAFEPIGESLQKSSNDQPQDLEGFLAGLQKLVLNQPAGSLTMLAYVADNLADPELEAALKATRRSELRNQTKIIGETLGTDPGAARNLGLLINACVNYAALVKLSGGSVHEVKQVLNALTAVITPPAKP